MALLSKVFRLSTALPVRKVPKMIRADRELDFSDDSDDGTQVYGNKFDPLEPPPAGMRLTFDEIPNSYFYEIADREKPRVAQPSYVAYTRGEQVWHVFNASALTLGRMASRIAGVLMAKHRPYFTHDRLFEEAKGDFVVVVNGKYPMIYGTKGKMKVYRRHTGQPGHMHELNIRQVLARDDWRRVVRHAVSGMLPSNKLRDQYLKRMHIYPEIYHDFEDLPQIVQKQVPDINEDLVPKDLFQRKDTKLVFASDLNDLPEELKHIKYEPMDFEVPLHKRPEQFKEYTPQEMKKLKKHLRHLRRFKVFDHRLQKFEIK
jgi:large subunit ribosomal protein L13